MVAAKCDDCKYSIVNSGTNDYCPFYIELDYKTCKNIHFVPNKPTKEDEVVITPSRFYTPPCEEGMKVVQPNILTTEE